MAQDPNAPASAPAGSVAAPKGRRAPPPAPRKHPPADAAERIRALAADGWSVRGIAANLGITHRTLYESWFVDHPELRDAMERGRDDQEHVLYNRLFRLATEGTGKDSMVAAMFILKCKFGWREGDQADLANRVAITFNVPAAMPLADFMTVDNGQPAEHRTERLSTPAPRATRRG